MVQGNFAHGEYWIDCDHISESVLRPLFGAWITLCAAVIAMCIRSVYRSSIKRRLFSKDESRRFVSLWDVSPATNPAEVFDLRMILARSIHQRNIFYLIASIVCVAAAIFSAASTTIANNTIVENVVIRKRVVDGGFVTHEHAAISGAIVNITSRADAFERAQAPLDQLFDFAPDDASRWTYVADEWNNTFQDEVPLLGALLPQWATTDPTRQGTDYSGFYTGTRVTNSSGAWRDQLVSYAFGSAPLSNLKTLSTVNISFANFLAHNVGRDESSDGFQQTAIKSDVHVVECVLSDSSPGIEDQAFAEGGQYPNSIGNVANLYKRSVIDASINQRPVIQPTGEQMLRNWQAFMSVKDGQYPHFVQRTLSVAAPVVQIRLSVLLTSVGGFLLAILAAYLAILSEPRDAQGERVALLGSQLDWIGQAAREHERGMNDTATTTRSPSTYAAQRGDLMFGVSVAAGGQSTARILSPVVPNDMSPPSLAYLNPEPLDIKLEKQATGEPTAV
ncbi:hypothetical protein BD410DRAFT_902415 [Rickenella mellea]|uniref:Transmembrane protein n=1 Tax=Rickenella mellea TaxID=50990 RepID=A0A4Y7PK37_9AGAM|nr:hypothetical protein BD410DRAFT_902415 [Rickenella mellea]